MKLQKLVYYAQAWALVWDGKPFFEERIEAWANDPVVSDLYYAHKGLYNINARNIKNATITNLSKEDRETIDVVLGAYSNLTSHQLIELTHTQNPWLDARKGYEIGDICNEEITKESMLKYYCLEN